MRFTYAEAMTDPSYHLPLARAAEAAGYAGVSVADSLVYPKESATGYPYTADGDRGFLEDKGFVETFVLIAAMGAVTSTIRFTPFVLKLPVRPPVLVAKQASSIAFLTGNRLGLGVGLSPWPEDFAAMGVPWARRGRRMDEAVEVLRGLTGGGYFEYHGEFYDLPPVKMSPVPTEPIPILVGGHSEGALRRAARLGDGWMHGGGDAAELDALLARLAALRAEYGTADRPFEIHAISADAYTPDGVARLADKGVTDLVVGFRNPYVKGPDAEPLSRKIEHLERFAEKVIARTGP
ncbi:TIGR03619 family F420-dependent LLM class oxidoreductase [Planomonospora sp. ID82291]|uniref:TIGR03619 family F420-dependent LLM class oxidoreductase n=1 Tax=Planomonospora sp. ID82291 TaxID=2738136 RepID=UPI0018C44ADA|nr:TIGR03619 family F420-dependent LLM class oxidoreductase [Planomonospora sp. ID82291]MBG0817843.1 TIGR03619 family F420-dependent LLM class oxidoreductase [Planomonospora sp. ID82291]